MSSIQSVREPKNFKINDRWFIDLDEHIDVSRFNALQSELAAGIALSMQHSEPVIIGSLDAQFDPSLVEVDLFIRQNPNHPEIVRLKEQGATQQQLYDFVKFSQRTLPLGRKILLRTYKNYHAGFALKHLARINQDTPAYANFPGLRKFLEDSEIFSEIGRIIIFLTERGAEAEIHCDYADGKSRRDQYVWFNPNKAKKFFVLNENFKKQYLTGVANVFDSATWHGGDPAPHATFTIRVDGVFSSAFATKAGIKEHFSRRPR